jgi:hypothetical protein
MLKKQGLCLELLFKKLVESIKKYYISMLRGEIEINRVDWLLKETFGTLI